MKISSAITGSAVKLEHAVRFRVAGHKLEPQSMFIGRLVAVLAASGALSTSDVQELLGDKYKVAAE